MPFYVYDSRTQYVEPVFIAYNREHVEPMLMAIYGCYPDYIEVYTFRMHDFDPQKDSFLGIVAPSARPVNAPHERRDSWHLAQKKKAKARR
jgi:hypothetical protein